MQMLTKLKTELRNSRKMIDSTLEGFKEDYTKTQEELSEKQHEVQALEVQTAQLQAKNREYVSRLQVGAVRVDVDAERVLIYACRHSS